MDKKKMYRILLGISIITLIGSYAIYLNFGSKPKELTPPKEKEIIKTKNLTGNITEKYDEYYIEYINNKEINLSNFGKIINERRIDNGDGTFIFDIYIKTENISKIIEYLKENKAKIDKIKRKIRLHVSYLLKDLEKDVYIQINNTKNETINLSCNIIYVDNVISRIDSCKVI